MPEGSSSKKPVEKTGFECPVFWRRIGAPVAILLAGSPWLLLFGIHIVDVILRHVYGYGIDGTTRSVKTSISALLGLSVWIVFALAPLWWVMLGVAVRRGAASRNAWILCTVLGFSFVAFCAYLFLSEM